MTASTQSHTHDIDFGDALDKAVEQAVTQAIAHYIASTPGNDREALARLQNTVSNIHLNALRVPDALNAVQDQHAANEKAQASAREDAKAPPPKSSSQSQGQQTNYKQG